MGGGLADAARRQWGRGKAKVLGKLVSLRFLGGGKGDFDVYEVDWECAKGEWAMPCSIGSVV